MAENQSDLCNFLYLNILNFFLNIKLNIMTCNSGIIKSVITLLGRHHLYLLVVNVPCCLSVIEYVRVP